MDTIFDKFKLEHEREDLKTVITNIETGVVFRGTNLWILIFAIFVASLGLNVNSAAVIIGAMLISPLMGPIMGMGLGVGINDLRLLRKSMYNFSIATVVALSTSTVFFLISPLSDAHSELLARTSPTIYDVLIALFGGFAGMVATLSKQKGNVIPGVAIATALMPPLCTAGYGIATLQLTFVFGAFYLFIINTVFIALATFIIVRITHFPLLNIQDVKADKLAQRIVWLIVVITLVPSLYFGYDVVERQKFTDNANRFINNEAHFPNDYLLKKEIDAAEKRVTLVFGGKEISSDQIELLKSELKKYNLAMANLEVKQGFAYLSETGNKQRNEQVDQLTQALAVKEVEGKAILASLDSIKNQELVSRQIFTEIRAQYPMVKNAVIQPGVAVYDSSGSKKETLVILSLSSKLALKEKTKLEKWLQVRMNNPSVHLIIQY